MAFKSDEEVKAFTEWAQQEIAGMGRYVHTNGLLAGELKGHCVWAMPGRIFIGKIWPASDKSKAYWIISGKMVTTDHIPVDMAETARDAARHFSLKWQLQGERFSANLGEASQEAESDPESWKNVGEQLTAQAELLYSIVEQDELWDTENQSIDKLVPREAKAGANGKDSDS